MLRRMLITILVVVLIVSATPVMVMAKGKPPEHSNAGGNGHKKQEQKGNNGNRGNHGQSNNGNSENNGNHGEGNNDNHGQGNILGIETDNGNGQPKEIPEEYIPYLVNDHQVLMCVNLAHNPHEITPDWHSVPAHLKNGKGKLGPCEEPPPLPVDVCPNIEGNQAEVPPGMIKDDQGNCVFPPPSEKEVRRGCVDLTIFVTNNVRDGEDAIQFFPGAEIKDGRIRPSGGSVGEYRMSEFTHLVPYGEERYIFLWTVEQGEQAKFYVDNYVCVENQTKAVVIDWDTQTITEAPPGINAWAY